MIDLLLEDGKCGYCIHVLKDITEEPCGDCVEIHSRARASKFERKEGDLNMNKQQVICSNCGKTFKTDKIQGTMDNCYASCHYCGKSFEIGFKDNYNIPFEEARKMDMYKFVSDVEEMSQLYQLIENRTEDRIIPVMLEFGFADIEVNVESDYSAEYYICIKDAEGNWQSLDYSGDEMLQTDDIEKLEKHMYECLVKYARENNVYLSIGNEL